MKEDEGRKRGLWQEMREQMAMLKSEVVGIAIDLKEKGWPIFYFKLLAGLCCTITQT